MQLVITGVDYAPEELEGQVPFQVELIRELPGPDRPDYWLGEVATPLRWVHDGTERQVTHLVLAARYEGARIEPGVSDLVVGIAFVTDPSQLDDAELDFGKCVYVAIGISRDDGGPG